MRSATFAMVPLFLLLPAFSACSGKADLAMDQVVEGSLDSTDQVSMEGPWEDRLTFDGSSGERVRIEMRSSDLDAFLRLHDPDGQLIASNDDALGRDAAITIRLPRSGRYVVSATSYGRDKTRGTYRLGVSEVRGDFADVGAVLGLEMLRPVEGVLEVGDSTNAGGGYVDYFAFRAPGDTVVQFDLVSTQFDAYLSLQDSTGVTLGSDDDSGGDRNARLVSRVTRGTGYRVAVTTFGQGARSGWYRLTVGFGTFSK